MMDTFGRRGGGRGGRGGGRGGRGGGLRGGRGRGGQGRPQNLGMDHSSGYEQLSQSYSDGASSGGYADSSWDEVGVPQVVPLDLDAIGEEVASNLRFGTLQPQGRILDVEESYGAEPVGVIPQDVARLASEVVRLGRGASLSTPSPKLERAAINFDAALTRAVRQAGDDLFPMTDWLLEATRISSAIVYGDAPSAPVPVRQFGALQVAGTLSPSKKQHLASLEGRQASLLSGEVRPEIASELSKISAERCRVLGLPDGCGRIVPLRGSSPDIDQYGRATADGWAQIEEEPSYFSQSVKVGAGVALGVFGVFAILGAVSGR